MSTAAFDKLLRGLKETQSFLKGELQGSKVTMKPKVESLRKKSTDPMQQKRAESPRYHSLGRSPR